MLYLECNSLPADWNPIRSAVSTTDATVGGHQGIWNHKIQQCLRYFQYGIRNQESTLLSITKFSTQSVLCDGNKESSYISKGHWIKQSRAFCLYQTRIPYLHFCSSLSRESNTLLLFSSRGSRILLLLFYTVCPM